MRIDEADPGIVALAGDWHANLGYAADAVRAARAGGAEAIVHVGDFGFLFERQFLLGLDSALGELPLYFVDGNHEDFDWLLAQPLDDDGTRPLARRIRHLPRGLRWRWRGRTWLALGGAHSVDRLHRDEGATWWPEERLTDEDVERASAPGRADVIVAHDAPAGVDTPRGFPPGTFPAEDERLGEEHRDQVRAVVDRISPELVVHGHHHRRYESRLGEARILGLAHDGDAVSRNLAWLDAATLEVVPPTARFDVV